MIVYCRGATRELINDDVKRTLAYVRKHGNSWLSVEAAAKVIHGVAQKDPSDAIIINQRKDKHHTGRRVEIHHDLDKATGELPGLTAALQATTREDVKEVVVTHADRLVAGDSGTQNIQTAVETYDITVHLSEQGVSIHGDTDLSETLIQSLRILSDVENNGANTGVTGIERHQGGRPPFGFTSEDGVLQPTGEYEDICRILQAVRDGRWSKRSAAKELGCTRATITNCLERPHRYNLN